MFSKKRRGSISFLRSYTLKTFLKLVKYLYKLLFEHSLKFIAQRYQQKKKEDSFRVWEWKIAMILKTHLQWKLTKSQWVDVIYFTIKSNQSIKNETGMLNIREV